MILALETGIEPEYEQALQNAAWDSGWEVRPVMNIPFTDQFITGSPRTGDPLPEEFLRDPDVWFHGSIQAAKRAQKATAWKVHAPWEQLRCQTYYEVLSDRILQKDHVFTTLGDLPAQRHALFNSDLAEDGTLFIRPDGNDKAFTGGCLSKDDFDEKYKLATFYDPAPSTLIVVARPQKIAAEARFLVVDGRLVTGSYYRTGRQTVRLEAPEGLLATAREFLEYCLAQGFNPAPSWVLDLAQTAQGWSIIEVGASSCCGLYKCDMNAFVEALDSTLTPRTS